MTSMNQPVANEQFSNVQPIWKFCFLYIITGGIYQLPWAHKQWKFIKERENLKISAWVRAWFLPFSLYRLCQRVFALAEEQGYREKPSPFVITLLYWVFMSSSSNLWLRLLSLLSLVPLLSVLKAMNYYWEQKQHHLPKRTSFTGREIIWIVFGVILWFVVILVMLLPAREIPDSNPLDVDNPPGVVEKCRLIAPTSGSTTKVRESAYREANVITELNRGTEVSAIGESGAFVQIKTQNNSITGWVFNDQIKNCPS